MSDDVPKLLRVNLSKGFCHKENIPEKTVADFVGGRGFGSKYLYDELQPGTDPLSPDNKLIFSIGPLAGIAGLPASRWMVTSKSPLTGTYFRSVGGGNFGAWMRFAGFDMIIVEGSAEKPVYLYIEDDRYEIRDAGNLWGKNIIEAQEALKEIHGPRVTSACIGPGGERLIRFASVMSERRAAGRGGLGAVMASKKLKAITINPSRRAKKLSKELKILVDAGVAEQHAHPRFPRFSDMGTLGVVEVANVAGIYPTRNFREGRMVGWKKIALERYARLKEMNTRCHGCIVHCGNILRVKSGPHRGVFSEGPEYETVNTFTGSINSSDIATTIVADSLCDEGGIDTISAGNSIGFAYELFERGIITKGDTGGLDLTYGNHEEALELLRMIINREGLGDILAEGVKRAAERIGKGAAEYAMHVKGLEIPAYEPRGAKWTGLNYIVSPCGANHNFGRLIPQEFQGETYPKTVDRFAEVGFADVTKIIQDRVAGQETGIMCVFGIGMRWVSDSTFCRLLASVMGIPQLANPETILLIGERIWNLERAFNIREGFGRKDDAYPRRFTTEPLEKAGPSEGAIIKNPEGMLSEYYAVRGWDKGGIPTPEKLKSLGLEKIAKDIIK